MGEGQAGCYGALRKFDGHWEVGRSHGFFAFYIVFDYDFEIFPTRTSGDSTCIGLNQSFNTRQMKLALAQLRNYFHEVAEMWQKYCLINPNRSNQHITSSPKGCSSTSSQRFQYKLAAAREDKGYLHVYAKSLNACS